MNKKDAMKERNVSEYDMLHLTREEDAIKEKVHRLREKMKVNRITTQRIRAS